MYSSFRLALKYIRYYITASNGKGHGIHSPFVYQFVRSVFRDVSSDPSCQQLEAYRRELLRDETILTVEDFGAGSVTGLKKERKVSQLAASSLEPQVCTIAVSYGAGVPAFASFGTGYIVGAYNRLSRIGPSRSVNYDP